MRAIILKQDKEKSLKRQHPWVFTGAIDHIKGNPRPGATVDVRSYQGEFLGKGAYSPQSQIACRIWSFEQSEVIDNAFFKRRIDQAFRLRQQWLDFNQTNAFRLIAAESDGLPGITIDKYDNVIVIQLLSVGADVNRDKIVNALKTLFPTCIIHERSDVAVRKKEGLDMLVATHVGTLPNSVNVHEHGIKYQVDLVNGHKTGFYLDQRKNRLITGQYCDKKRVLNCFSYTGTFALQAIRHGAREVINVDVSESALATSQVNARLNFDEDNAQKIKHLKADVFEQLRRYEETDERFDVIVMDPPKFIENKRHLHSAARGYKDINRIAFKLLNPGGMLMTFSCSGLMEPSLFQKIIADAALDANVEASIVEFLHQDADHLISTRFPEGLYLKGIELIKR